MKKSLLTTTAVVVTAAMLATGCGAQAPAPAEAPAAETEVVAAETEAPAEETVAVEEETEAPAEEAAPAEGVAEIVYSNINYDFAADYQAEREALNINSQAADIDLHIEYENGASGNCIVAGIGEGNEDYYLNTFIAGVPVKFSSIEGAIASATSSKAGDLEVVDGTATVTPAPINLKDADDEIITITMEDGTEYHVHTAHELLPGFELTGEGVAEANKGVYSFAVDKFMLRVNTEGELIYARNFGSVGECMAENFQRQETKDGVMYTAFIELRPQFRNANGGYSSGFYLVMDENYRDVDEVHLLANTEENHTHGEGYLDQHEFVAIAPGHYLTLSYTPELVENLPEGVEGLDGGNTGWVWAGVFQEVKDGEVLHEINTTDYPLLYESAVEKLDYAHSTTEGVTVTVGQNEIQSYADGIMDYVHVNSLDYTCDAEGNTDKLLVSMRDQSAVYQFDINSGEIEWILGGKASTLGGYDEFTTDRLDEAGNEFKALTFGQHFARYTNLNEDRTLSGNPEISVFDNQTGNGPFVVTPDMCGGVPTITRTFKAAIDPAAGTATVSDVIVGKDLNDLTGKYHNASHCGSVQYDAADSVTIGWGLHGVIDNIGAFAPEGTFVDPATGFMDLRQGSIPVFTEYDPTTNTVNFELTVTRNPLIESHEGLFSYRTYKTAE